MNIAAYGRRLVERYNAGANTRHTARTFFDEVFYPLVYDHAKPLQSVTNSPFFVLFRKSKEPVTAARRREALGRLHAKIDTTAPDGSFVVGYPACGAEAVTSGQVGLLSPPTLPEDAYATWIGAALGLTISGGQTLLFDDDELLWMTFEGWSRYRAFINHPPAPNIKGMEINVWNAWWLAHRLSGSYDAGEALPPYQVNKDSDALATMEWAALVLALARRRPGQTLTAYVFMLDKTNTTVGFLPLRLPEIARLYAVFDQYFANEAGLNDTAFQRLYRTDAAFRAACERGAIGLQALPPSGLDKYLHARADKAPSYGGLGPADYILYLTWILAMLGPQHEDLYRLSEETAQYLGAFARQTRGTERNNLVSELLRQPHKSGFMKKLADIVEKEAEAYAHLEPLFRRVYAMPAEQLTLFLTLIRFHHAGLAGGASHAND